jgi:hypothetical protein
MKRRLHADGTRACPSYWRVEKLCDECKEERREYRLKYRRRRRNTFWNRLVRLFTGKRARRTK